MFVNLNIPVRAPLLLLFRVEITNAQRDDKKGVGPEIPRPINQTSQQDHALHYHCSFGNPDIKSSDIMILRVLDKRMLILIESWQLEPFPLYRKSFKIYFLI